MIYFMSASYMFFKLFSPAIFSMCNNISFDTLPYRRKYYYSTSDISASYGPWYRPYTIRWQLSACILNIEEFPITRGFIYIFDHTIH